MKKIYKVKVNGKTYKVELQGYDELVTKEAPKAETKEAKKEEAKPAEKAAPAGSEEGKNLPSPIQGTVLDFKVKPGDTVKKGQVLLVVEAMKLENDVVSPSDGVVGELLVSKGANVTAGQPLLTIE